MYNINTANFRMSLRSQQKKDRVVYMDFETTGLNVFQCEITEVALYDNMGHQYESIVQIEGTVSEYVQRLTGITMEKIKTQGQPVDVVIGNICNFINGDLGFLYGGEYRAPSASFIVGHNLLQFDLPLLKVQIQRCNARNKSSKTANKSNSLRLPNDIAVIDTLIVAQKYYTIKDDPHNPYKRKYSLENLSATLPLKNRPSHRAMSDVLATCELLEVVRSELAQRKKPNTLSDIYNDAMRYHTQ